MAAYVSNIVIDVGADFNQTFNLEGSNNAPLDLTGYTGAARMKKHPSSINTTATFSVSFLEFIYSSSSIHYFLLSSVKRM